MSRTIFKLTAIWLIIIVCGTTWFYVQLKKDDQECINTCAALGKEAVYKEPGGNRYRMGLPNTCRCSE